MYVGYSWPKVLQCPGPQGRYVAVFQDHTYLVAVSGRSIVAWSSGHARVRLGQHNLSQQELEQYGRHVSACWSPERNAVAVLTEAGYLLLYGLHVTKQLALPSLKSNTWGVHDGSQCLHAVDVYVKHTVRCERAVPATCMCCDSRAILVAYADGFWGSCSWSGKMHPELYDIMPDGCDEEDNTQQQQQQQKLPRHAAVDIHYCGQSRLLSVVFADGSAALYSPPGTGYLQPQLTFRRWLCTAAARATVARIAPQAQLIALGTAAGEVHLLRQHCPAAAAAPPSATDTSLSPLAASTVAAGAFSPMASCGQTPLDFDQAGLDPQQLVRTLDLIDWGHTSKQTGAVAALAWAPDNRALAVGHSKQGLVVWTPSGCRLLSTLRQPPPETPASGRASAASPFTSSGGGIVRPQRSNSVEPPAAANGGAASSDGSQALRLQHPGVVSVDGSVLCLSWGVDGYQLMLAGQPPQLDSQASTAASGSSSSGGGGGGIMYELSLAKSLRHHHRVTHAAAADGGAGTGVAQLSEELHVLQASDRLLLITEPLTSNGPSSFLAAGMGSLDPSEAAGGSSSDLHVHHVLLPAAYLAANWPLQHVAVSPCGSDIAAAGVRGLVVYNRKQERWRMFGEVMQERRVSCVAMGWLSGCVVVASCSTTGPEPAVMSPAATAAAAAAVSSAAATGLDLTRGAGAGFKCQLLLFPRNHLDFSSVVASTTLHKVPLAMDCTDNHILLASAPLELLVLQLEGFGSSGGNSGPDGRPSSALGKTSLVAVRELSLFNVGRPVQDVALVSAAAADMAQKALRGQLKGSWSGGSEPAAVVGTTTTAPRHAVLLRWGGMLSVLDLSRGAELLLAEEVESFLLSDTLSVPTVAPSSKAGSTCASAGHSRTSSIQGLPAAVTSAGQEVLLGPGSLASAADEGVVVSGGGVSSAGHVGGGSISGSSCVDPLAANTDTAQEVAEVVEMPWWAYGAVGMQLWFPSIVLAAMQLQSLHSSSSNTALHSQASLPAQLTPHAAVAAGLGPGTFIGGLGSRSGSGVPASLGRSGSLWSNATGPGLQAGQGGSGSMAALAAAGAAAAAAGAQPGSARAASLNMKHAQSAPALSQDGGTSAGGFQAIQYGTEIELEFDREVYPIGVSLADASIVGVTQRVMRPQQQAAATQSQSPKAGRSSLPSRHHPLSSQGSLPAAATSSSNSLSLPCLLPVPESQPVLPALLRRLLQQGALPEALALAKRHEGGPHFKRSLEWLLFTTLDMEGSKCKPDKAGVIPAGGQGRDSSWQQDQQQPLHVLQSGSGAAGSGVLGRQGKGWLGHVDGQPRPVPVTALLAAAVDLVLSFQQCLDVVVSVSRKTDASLWPAMFSAVGSPSAVLQLLLDKGSLTSAACFLIVVDRLEGSHAAQKFAVQLIKLALKRGQFYLCAEILRFLIPPREGVLQWGPSSPVAAGVARAPSLAIAPQRQPSVSAAAAGAGAGSNQTGWFTWIWGGDGANAPADSQQQQQQPAAKGSGKPSAAGSANGEQDVIAAGYAADGLVSQASLNAVAGPHGSDACAIVASKAWKLLEQGKLRQLVQLIHSMSFLTGGLASIMAAFKLEQLSTDLLHADSSAADMSVGVLLAGKQHSQQQQQQPLGADAAPLATALQPAATELTVDILISCVLAAVEELPVWESTDVEQDAILVLELVKELQIERWTLAIAVVLVDMSVLAPFAAVQPTLWQNFCGQLLEQPELYFLHQLVGALVTSSSPEPLLDMGGTGGAVEEDLLVLQEQQQQQQQ